MLGRVDQLPPTWAGAAVSVGSWLVAILRSAPVTAGRGAAAAAAPGVLHVRTKRAPDLVRVRVRVRVRNRVRVKVRIRVRVRVRVG